MTSEKESRWKNLPKQTMETATKYMFLTNDRSLTNKDLLLLLIKIQNVIVTAIAFLVTFLRALGSHKSEATEVIDFPTKLKEFVGKNAEFAFCLTDIVGSSKLWNDVEYSMKMKVRKHISLGFRLAKETNGYVSKVEGDSFFVVFENASDAIEFGKRMIKENRKCEAKPTVDLRVGVAVGDARVGRGEHFMFIGEGVKKVYKLNDIAKPNTILTDNMINHDIVNKCK